MKGSLIEHLPRLHLVCQDIHEAVVSEANICILCSAFTHIIPFDMEEEGRDAEPNTDISCWCVFLRFFFYVDSYGVAVHLRSLYLDRSLSNSLTAVFQEKQGTIRNSSFLQSHLASPSPNPLSSCFIH